jgi:TPR repeat protein
VAISFFMSATPEVEYQPRVDMRDSVVVAKTQAAARKGDVQSQYDLGWTYWQRDDYSQALPLIKAAASQGHVEAQYLLGQAYLHGRGTVQNYRAALEQFTQAANQGHLDAEYQLGIFYRDGLATPRNRETAYVWLNIATARGHADALALRDRLSRIMTGEEILRAPEASTETHKRLNGQVPAKP